MKHELRRLDDRPYGMACEKLVSVAATLAECTAEELIGNSRDSRMVQCRFLVMFYLNVRYGYSLTRAGKTVGRNHATVVHVVRETLANPRRYRQMFEMMCRFENLLSAIEKNNSDI